MATTPNALFSGSLIGDVIVQAREAIPDAPSTLPAPPTPTVGVVSSPGSTLPAGTYFVEVTQINNWGETVAAAESSQQTIGANQGIQITSPLQATAVAIRAYVTPTNGSSGTEQGYIQSTTSPFTISSLPTNSSPPPSRNTAWLPDTDGSFLSAYALFRYLNAGLEIIIRETGGIQDYSGLGSVINQPLYTMPGFWNSITSIWYDGYWMLGGDPGYFWRRNSITSQILSSAHVSVISNQMVLEVYPQPARTSLTTALASNMLATDTVATLNSNAFTLPFGFASIGSEIVAYATLGAGNKLTGLIRGLGGTGAIAHSSSEVVVETNIVWMGKRQSIVTYLPGQSATVLPIPPGWDQLLVQYIIGRSKLVEHDLQAIQSFNQEMRMMVKEWAKTNKGIARRRQVGPPNQPSVYGQTLAGGLIIN